VRKGVGIYVLNYVRSCNFPKWKHSKIPKSGIHEWNGN